jgi:hypothetical protein
MSSTIAQPSNMKSMNGIVTYDDGAGTVISGGTITASALNTQNITAPDPAATSSVYATNSNTITIGNPYTPVYVERACASAFEVANKAYVDAQTGGAVTLGGTNTWTGQNTFDVYPPLCYLSPTSNDNLVNKLYVDLTVAGGSSSLLAADNVWTGTNEFNNITVIGKADQSSTITINGEVFIGDGINSPGHNTTIVGDEVKLQGFNTIDMVGDVFFKNSVPQSSIHINTASNAAIPEIDFQTNTSNTSIVTSSIIASGGTTLNTGKIQINGGDILIGQDDHSNTVLITGSVQIGDTLNSPAKNTGICGEETTLQGFSNVDIVSPLTTIRTPASQQSMTLDPTSSGTMKMNFRTNTSNTSQISSNITATGGTTVNGGNLNLTAGVITNVTPEFVVNKSTTSTSMTVDTNTASEVETRFNTNPSDPSMSTVRMVAASGTVADKGRFSFYASIVEWFSTSVTFWSGVFSQSLLIDLSNTVNAIGLRFRTNGGSTTTSSIFATGTTTTDSVITTTSNASWFKNKEIYLDSASGGNSQMNMYFYTNTSTPTTLTSSIVASGGTTANTGDITLRGNLTSLTNRYVLFNSATGGSNQIDLNFYTYPSNPGVVTSAIYASGGTASSLSGTINASCNTFTVAAPTLNLGNGNGTVDINGTSINLDSTNTYLNSYMYINTANTSAIFLNLPTGSYPVLANTPMTIIPATATTMTFSNITMGVTYYYAFNRTVAATISLSDTVSRDGNYVYVVNQSNFNVVISCASARLFGNSVTRGGVTTRTLTPNTACKITCCMNLGGRMANTSLQYGYFIQTMT